jgi:hypothetical protein
MKELKGSWKQTDFRINSLSVIIHTLENLINELKEKCNEISWYRNFFVEESELICGIAFIALQNYINSSIFDIYETLEKKEKKYKLGKPVNKTGRTSIELIIGLANYYKHRDNNHELNKGTSKILTDFKIEYSDLDGTYDSPIFKGLQILSKDWELSALTEIVQDWRENLWRDKENTNHNSKS